MGDDRLNKIKVCSLFSGIGGFETGIFNAVGKGNVEVVFASEIDKYAAKAYEIIYGHKPHGDITKIPADDIPDHDVLVGGFPCQAFSVAGKRLGFEDTRGTLFFEVARIANKKKPKALVLENVKGLVNHNKGSTLETILLTLSDIGYAVDFQVLNSKYFDVPQNRERIIIVALRDIEAEEWVISGNDIVAKAKKKLKNADGIKTFNFKFPEQNKVNKIIKDILEENVDEKYYISEDKMRSLIERLFETKMMHDDQVIRIDDKRGGNSIHSWDIGLKGDITKEEKNALEKMILERRKGEKDGNPIKPEQVGSTIKNFERLVGLGYLKKVDGGYDFNFGNLSFEISKIIPNHGLSPTITSTDSSRYSVIENNVLKQISPTLNTSQGGNNESKILVEYDRENGIGKQLDIAFTINLSDWRGLNRNQKQNAVLEKEVFECSFRTRNYKGQKQQLEVRKDEISNTVTSVPKDSMLLETKKYRIRKLTPLECFRLQGFPDEYYHKLVEVGISNSQLYKMAGNAVTTNKITAVFKNLYEYIIN